MKNNLEFYFFPNTEIEFKEKALNQHVRIIIFESTKNQIVDSYSRKVSKFWSQTCKNNIETDHRIKNLPSGNYHIYSWVSESSKSFNLPMFEQHV